MKHQELHLFMIFLHFETNQMQIFLTHTICDATCFNMGNMGHLSDT